MTDKNNPCIVCGSTQENFDKNYCSKDCYDTEHNTTEEQAARYNQNKDYNKPELYAVKGSFLDINREIGINWSAKGTVTTEEAEQFIRELQEAIEKAKEINNSVVSE